MLTRIDALGPRSVSLSLPADQPDATGTSGAATPDALIPADFKAGLSLLVVDDERSLRESCRMLLESAGYRVEAAGRGDEAQQRIRKQAFDIVLTDLYMPEVSGLDVLQTCQETNPSTIVIVMTGNPSVASNVEALKLGAWDYLPKPFSATHLQILVGRAAHAILVAREPHAELGENELQGAGGERVAVLGVSPPFRLAIELARKVARTDASVFITGESGTGKELIAQFIHQHSRRSSRAIVAVNCAALPEGLLESEMFGHVKGAFTGAVKDKAGLLETANGGTLFLDELIDMPKPVQAKLLRVIQDGVVRRLGSATTSAVVNVRFVAAANRDPELAVKEGALREDLFYRLRVVPIKLPPLRERPEDIPLLAMHFLQVYWSRHRGTGSPLPTFSAEALRALTARPWHGNVRELQNAIEHTVVLLDPGQQIQPDDIPAGTTKSDDSTGDDAGMSFFDDGGGEKSYHAAREQVVAGFERRYLTWLVSRANGNMSRAARIAGVDRTTLYRLMERHGLQRETITVLPE